MAYSFEKLYFASPVWFQNLMVSVYGVTLQDKRYGQPHDRFLAELESHELSDKKRVDEIQWQMFHAILTHALATVPFYRELAQQQNLTPNDFRNFQDIAKLPVVDKEMIRRNPKHFCSTPVLDQGAFILHTSGTTGTALAIYVDKESRRRHYAFWTRLRHWFGVRPGMKRATIFGRIICRADSSKPPFWRYDAIGRNMLMSSYHLSSANLPAYAAKLAAYQPAEIIGYASSVFLLAKYLAANPGHGIAPKVVFTTADKLQPHFRPIIQQAFGCPVIDQYGCAEMATFVSQREKGEYFVHPEHGFLEVLGTDDRPVGPGETGEAVCTGFINRAMPLLRYRLGDRITLTDRPAGSDNRVPVFAEIEGRRDDILYSPNGRPLGRFSPIWKVVEGIYETQVIQKSLSALDINIVVDPEFRADPERESTLEAEIRKRTGSEMVIKFHYVDTIPKNSNGKFKTVVSEVQLS